MNDGVLFLSYYLEGAAPRTDPYRGAYGVHPRAIGAPMVGDAVRMADGAVLEVRAREWMSAPREYGRDAQRVNLTCVMVVTPTSKRIV